MRAEVRCRLKRFSNQIFQVKIRSEAGSEEVSSDRVSLIVIEPSSGFLAAVESVGAEDADPRFPETTGLAVAVGDEEAWPRKPARILRSRALL